MQRLMATILAVLVVAVVLPAQMKVLSYKKLQECLPAKDVKGFERKKPTGKTESVMGMSTSEAVVEYLEPMKVPAREGEDIPPQISVSVKIQDMVGMPYAMMPYAWMVETESEDEDSYQKSVMVLGKYKGQEEGGTTDDNKFTKVAFGVLNRFIVEINVTYKTDTKLLGQFAGMVDYAKLEKLMTEAK